MGLTKAYDTNHDSNLELIFYVNNSKYFVADYEYASFNQYLFADTLKQGKWWLQWAFGDFNNNTYTDMLISGPSIDTINIYESSSYNTYPKNYVTRLKTNLPPGFTCLYYYVDLDRDGLTDILTYSDSNDTLSVYENTTGNNYALAFQQLVVPYSAAFAFAIGDADMDNKTEFITGGTSGRILIYKCFGNNDYQIIWMDTTRISRAAYDPVFVPDMDGDSLPEFIMGCFHVNSSGKYTAVWKYYEADTTNANNYNLIFVDSLNTNEYSDYTAVSSCGDIDGDGITEAVLATQNNWVIYKATGDNQFQRIYKAYATVNGRNNTSLCVADMNGNGYAEVIEGGVFTSTTSETKIWEIMGEVTFDSLRLTQLDSCIQVKWATSKQFASYGFNLWRAVGADSNYSIIHETNDTIRLDTALLNYTFNDSNVTTGLTYYYKVQAKALNDSSLFFGPVNVLYTGISGKPWEPVITYSYKLGQNAPNPFKQLTTINYQLPKAGQVSLKIYNIAGQVVKTLTDGVQGPGAYNVKWNGMDQNNQKVSNGIYFYKLVTGDKQAIKKMIILK